MSQPGRGAKKPRIGGPKGRHSRRRERSATMRITVVVVLVALLIGGVLLRPKSHDRPSLSIAAPVVKTTTTSPTLPLPTSNADRQAVRARAGAILRTNPGIVFAPSTVTDLLAGSVDARVMATLSIMAGEVSALQVLAFSGDAPRRTVEITAGDPDQAAAFLAAQQPPFRPDIIRRGAVLRVTFPPDLACQQRLNPQECP
jgi:hypothetical protein